MASNDDNMDLRPLLVVLPPDVRAKVSKSDRSKDILTTVITGKDISEQFRNLMPFEPSWAPTADYVQIEPMLCSDVYAHMHYFAGTVNQLVDHLRTHVPLAMIKDVLLTLPKSDDQSYIFILGAYEVPKNKG